MAAIAAEAGVALKTVYLAFETKSGVLRALWNLLLRGDDDEAPVASAAWYREVLEEPDPERQLRLTARNSRMVKERIGRILGVIRSAAPVEPDIAALWDLIQSDFYDEPARDRGDAAQAQGAAAGLDVEARDRHPVDAEPPRRVAAAGRRARLDGRSSGSGGSRTRRAASCCGSSGSRGGVAP